jgi:hypothetical protein
MVRAKLSEYGLCKVVRIDMHEKKEKTKNGGLRSLNHNYAFVVVIPLDTFQGNQFLENLKTHKNTHMIHDNDGSKYWTIKPHLSMEERFDKGFSLLHEPICKNANKLQVEKAIVTETETEEEEEEEPDWLHEPISHLNLSDIRPLPMLSNDCLEEVPECMRFMTEETVREAYELSVQRKSYFDTLLEKMEIYDDYDDIERDLIRVHRLMQVVLM